MENNLADANAAPDVNDDLGAGNPSTPGENEAAGRPVDFINTVDDNPAKGQDKGTADKTAADDPANAGGKDGAGADGDLDRFDKHPRFQELMSKISDLSERNAKLEGFVSAIQSQKGGNGEGDGKTTGNAADPNFKDISQMSKEEIIEWFEENPVEFLSNYAAQVRHEFSAQDEATTRSQKIADTFQTYEKNHADFKPMWESGKIEEYMNEHPGHNAISAHMTLTIEDRIKDAVDKAVKETEQRVIKNFQAKRDAGTMGDAGGGGRGSENTDNGLNNTKQSGGLVAAIAARLSERRRGAGG